MSININPKNKGKFTKIAKAAGKSVQEEAASVLRDPQASGKLTRAANFAKVSKTWNHKK